jgi:hypothetical protein
MRSLLLVLAILAPSHALAEPAKMAFGVRADVAGLASLGGHGVLQMMGVSGWARYRPVVVELAIDHVSYGTSAFIKHARAGVSLPLITRKRWQVRVPVLVGYSFGFMEDGDSGPEYDHRAVLGTTGLDMTRWSGTTGLTVTATGFVGPTFGRSVGLTPELEINEMTYGVGVAIGLALRGG